MAALTSAQHVFMFLWIIGSVAAGESLRENATPGEDVTLRCNSSTDAAITLLEWSRPELEEDYVFLFKNNKSYENYQDPRYRGRVQLKDPEMKNGDASVLLKNVDIEDTGTYECRVITSQTRRKRAADEKLVSSVLLVVSEGPEKPEGPEKEINDEHPGGPGGHVGLGVGVGVGLGLMCLMVGGGVVGLKNKKSQRVKVKGSEECFNEVLSTPDCPPSPASKLNNLLPESLPCRGGGAY